MGGTGAQLRPAVEQWQGWCRVGPGPAEGPPRWLAASQSPLAACPSPPRTRMAKWTLGPRPFPGLHLLHRTLRRTRS